IAPGYQSVGKKPCTTLLVCWLLGNSTTAMALLPALATNRFLPSALKTKASGSLPKGSVEEVPKGSVEEGRTNMVSRTALACVSITVTVSELDRKSTRLNSSHRCISYAVFCL